MGAFLADSKGFRKREKGSSIKADSCEEKLEKAQDQGINMAIERTYNVPLRREFLKSPRYRRAKKAVSALIRFIQRHMKSEEVYIGRRLNEKIWERGMKNPPHHVNIAVVKEDDGKVYAELVGFKYEKPLTEEEEKKAKKEEKKEEKAGEKKEVREEKAKKEKPAEIKKGEKKIEEEFKKLEEKTEKIKETKAKSGEEKEKKLERMEKDAGTKKVPKQRGEAVSLDAEKRKKERQAND